MTVSFRDTESLQRVRNYIADNPMNWDNDEDNLQRTDPTKSSS